MWKHRAFRTCVSLGMILGGAALLVYGLLFHVTTVSSAGGGQANVVTRPEPVLIQDVTIGRGRPAAVEVAESDVEPVSPSVEPGDSSVEVDKPAVESGEPDAALAKEGETPGEPEAPKPAEKKEAPKACPT